MEGLLGSLLGQLRDALLATPFTAEPARAAGAALGAAGIQRPEALERSLVFLDESLLAALELDDYTYRPLMTRLLAGLAGGWAGVLRAEAARNRRARRQATTPSRRSESAAAARRRGA